jgi:two-component system, chemotaxis family, CheB/CheR fusion protein
MRALIEEAIQSVRTLTVELSPPALEQEGLAEALQWLADRMQHIHGLSVHIEAEGSCGVTDKNLRVLLFQILRELLFNVVKHADVDHAAVRLYCQNNEYIAIVSDQGKGFETDSRSSPDNVTYGFGLTNVSERLKLFGGRLEIQSSSGAGAQVTVVLPISSTEMQ